MRLYTCVDCNVGFEAEDPVGLAKACGQAGVWLRLYDLGDDDSNPVVMGVIFPDPDSNENQVVCANCLVGRVCEFKNDGTPIDRRV